MIKKIKDHADLAEKQICIFTDLSDEDSRQRSLENGADYVFFKEEFGVFEFAEKVKKIIHNQTKAKNTNIEAEDEENDDETWGAE